MHARDETSFVCRCPRAGRRRVVRVGWFATSDIVSVSITL